MSTERESFVLVPNAGHSALLVSGEKLPCVRSRSGAAGVIEALRQTWSLDAPYLRPARILRDDTTKQTSVALYEFDAPHAEWEPPAEMEWLGLDDADPEALSLPGLAPCVAGWLAITGGAPIPEARPPWARSGWLAEASGWMEESMVEAGLQPVGPVEVVEQWPLSSVLRRGTRDGHVYMKAVFSTFHHEPAFTRSLATEHPALVPDVLALDASRGWMLMRELPGTQIGELEMREWSDALRAAAGVHRAWSGRTGDLFALGAQDRRLAVLTVEIEGAFEAVGLVGSDRAVSQLETRCEELGEGPLPQTLVHGDLHPWNVMVDGDDLRIFDWSDACVTHPLFDLPTFLQRADDESARRSMLDAYLGAWADLASLDELRAAYQLALPLAHVHHAISYLRISEALEPDDRWWFEDEPRGWLTGAVELLETP
ncbi:MAG: aminoglycoside phosphotransferase family protein [Actinomycetota bacterium]|nr:aminoglycoside phosphotransferase family protein [Actinomycetota bacterium]